MEAGKDSTRDLVKVLEKKYNFRGLLHFTDFSNLHSIINIGYLLSRGLCYAYSIDFYDLTSDEYANDYVKFYFAEKNDKALGRLTIPVYLVFSQDLLAFDMSLISNSAHEAALVSDCHKFKFNKQTQLLVAQPVSLKYLKEIIFRCDADYKRACCLYGKNKLYAVDPHMFFHEDNYIKDYNIYYDPENHKDLFVLHFTTNRPVKNDINHLYKLYDLKDRLIRTTRINFLESPGTSFSLEVGSLKEPVKFKLVFHGTICIEEVIG